MAQLYEKFDNSIRVGDPFLSAFLPVFDVDNDQLGLAIARRALPRSAITPGDATPLPSFTPTSYSDSDDQHVEEMLQ